jgi:hypothetical protein
VRNRRHVGDIADLEAAGVQGAHRGLAAGARPLDLHIEVLQTVFLGGLSGTLRRNLGGEGRALARPAETGPAGRGPAQGVTLAIRDGDDRVVEGRVNVRDPVGDVRVIFLRVPLAPGFAMYL